MRIRDVVLVAAGVLLVVGFAAQRGRGAIREVALRVLSQAGDSARVEIVWTAAGPTPQVTGYEIRLAGSGWTRGGQTSSSQLADTIWIPLLVAGESVTGCVKSMFGTLDGQETCGLFQAPPAQMTPPGMPQFRVLPDTGAVPPPPLVLDSATMAVMVEPAEWALANTDSIGLDPGATRTLVMFGWLGGRAHLCGEENGVRGWRELVLAFPNNARFFTVAPGGWIDDPVCRWSWSSSDEAVATLQPITLTAGTLSFEAALLSGVAAPADLPPFRLALR